MNDSHGAEPIVDRATLSELERDVGAEVVLSLIEMFVDSGPQRISKLREEVRADETAAAAEVLHSLKSSALMLGALRLSQLVEQAERAARASQSSELAALLEPIDAASEQVIEFLREYRGRLQS